MTQTELAKRLIKAIAETEEALARANRYSPDLRDHDLITVYENSLQSLKARLATI